MDKLWTSIVKFRATVSREQGHWGAPRFSVRLRYDTEVDSEAPTLGVGAQLRALSALSSSKLQAATRTRPSSPLPPHHLLSNPLISHSMCPPSYACGLDSRHVRALRTLACTDRARRVARTTAPELRPGAGTTPRGATRTFPSKSKTAGSFRAREQFSAGPRAPLPGAVASWVFAARHVQYNINIFMKAAGLAGGV